MKTRHEQNDLHTQDNPSMQHRHYLMGEYPDLLADDPDEKLVSLVCDLDTACAPVRLPAHLSASIRQALRSGTPTTATTARPASQDRAPMLRRWLPWLGRPQGSGGPRGSGAAPAFAARTSPRPAYRPLTTLALAVAVLCLVGAGYAALPALERLFEAHTGTGAIIAGNLGREVNVSRTVDGFTVAVRRVYADPNKIVIGLTVSGPAGRTFNHIMPWGEWYGYDPQRGMGLSPVLTDERGREFSGGLGGQQGGMQDGTAPYLLDYEGTGIGASGADLPREITVHLRVGMLSAYEALPGGKYQDVFVEGPFLFDLRIPVEPGRAADLHQTVEADGHSVTLERVVTAPTGTRLSLRGAGPNADVRLVVDGVTYEFHKPDGMAIPLQWTADSVWEYVSGTPLLDKQGEWELTVRPGTPVPADADPAATRLEGGPWTFKFTVPPAPAAPQSTK